MGDGWGDLFGGPYSSDWAYKSYAGKPEDEVPKCYGTTTVSGSPVTYTTDTITITGNTTWSDGNPYYVETTKEPTEYTLEEGILKVRSPETYEWIKLDEWELEFDPFPPAEKPKKARATKRAKIKVNKKIHVDMEKVADELF